MECVGQLFKGMPILKAENHTFLILIPKTTTATEIADFRTMYCVNLIYKVLTKIIADRISKVSPEFIASNSTTFIQGRLISDNTILVDEKVYGFGRKRTSTDVVPTLNLKRPLTLSGIHHIHSQSLRILLLIL